ncbi:MAG: glycoside hydrolase family 28 protein [Sphingobacteriaceae bacterium]|nr:glycoside hydrolase family 28 protein [Sphingobacteriaceae bacterium]
MSGLTSLAKDVNITSYGAVDDGKTVNSVAIQKAIDECSSTGGGKVKVPAGKWLCGTILLKNNVVLSMEENAVLLGSTNIADYSIVDGFTDGTGQIMGYCFVGAVDANNTGIEGKGIIDGQGKQVLAANGKSKRPFLIRFVRCNNISITGLNLRASCAWTMHIFRCKNVKVQGVTIFSRGLANNDGIDIDCCEGVSIKSCNITSDDDAICFKTTSPYPCKNIEVSDIKIRTRCAAVKFGTESIGDFLDIKVKDVYVSYAGLGIVKILSVDGAQIRNIDIRNINADTANVPLMIRLGARLKTFRKGDVKKPVGSISNVSIKNVNVKNATSVTGMLFTGVPSHLIQNISLENIAINSAGGGTVEDSKVILAENEAAYPEVRMFGKSIPSYGLYLRHAQKVSFKNVSFTANKADARYAIVADDVNGLEIRGWKLPAGWPKATVGSFTNVKDVDISNSSFDKNAVVSR